MLAGQMQAAAAEPTGADISLLLRIGAVCYVLGVVFVLVTEYFHPHQADPGDSLHAFSEYAQSTTWTNVHAAQFLGELLLLAGFVALAPALRRDRRWPAALAWLGQSTAIATMGIVAALQAVDGVTLKFVVDRWAAAPEAERAGAFRIAEAVRWAEIGLNSYFRLGLGVTLLLYGMAVAAGTRFPRWVSWPAIVGGLAMLVQGVLVGHVGFAAQVRTVSAVAALAATLWFIAMAVVMWRRGRDDPLE